MAVNITPPPVIDLSRKPWETFDESECYGGPYTITFNSNAAIEERTDQLGICKLNFQSNGPITFIDNKDSGERLNLEYQLRNGQQFEFSVLLNRDTLNQLEREEGDPTFTNFDFSAAITAVEQTSMISWYELDFLEADISPSSGWNTQDHIELPFDPEQTMTHTRAFLRKVERKWDGPKPWPNGEDLGFIATAEYPESWRFDLVDGPQDPPGMSARTAAHYGIQPTAIKVPAGESTAAHAKLEFTYERDPTGQRTPDQDFFDQEGGFYVHYEVRPVAGPNQVLTNVAGNPLPPLIVTLTSWI